jgi:hypothetical protein
MQTENIRLLRDNETMVKARKRLDFFLTLCSNQLMKAKNVGVGKDSACLGVHCSLKEVSSKLIKINQDKDDMLCPFLRYSLAD